MDTERDEQELAQRARDGDEQSLAELLERARLRLFALAYEDLRHYEDAQDAVAAAFLQICWHITELRQPQRVRAWMQSIVRNEVRRIRRVPDAAWLRLEGPPTQGSLTAASPGPPLGYRKQAGSDPALCRDYHLNSLLPSRRSSRTMRRLAVPGM
jgi:DNA-directed RNA polymerase specialized sigma24 family protein